MKKNIFLILLVACSFYSFAQEITGTTRTSDKYSEAIREINKGYFENDFQHLINSFQMMQLFQLMEKILIKVK